jgi:hypothetical protein
MRMSALAPTPDLDGHGCEVRFVPNPEIVASFIRSLGALNRAEVRRSSSLSSIIV